MVQSDTSKSPPIAAVAQESQMELLESAAPAGALGAQSYGKGARRKNRFKGSDGSTSSDTTSNSFVRQPGCLVSELQGIHLSPPLVPTTGVSEMYYHGGFIMWMLGQIHFSANDYAANTLLTEPSPQPQTFGVLFG